MKKLLRSYTQSDKGFTLIELLVVIAIILILSSILLFAINPAELLKKARDSQRISDLNTLATSINLYLADYKTPVFDTGTAGQENTTYFSYLATTAACGASPPAFLNQYYTATETTKKCNGFHATVDDTARQAAIKVDNTGWVPVDLTKVGSDSSGSNGQSPVPGLPMDPIGITCGVGAITVGSCDTYFFRFTFKGTKYALDAVLESTNNKSKCQNDGGLIATSFEIGNSTNPDALTTQARTNAGGCA